MATERPRKKECKQYPTLFDEGYKAGYNQAIDDYKRFLRGHCSVEKLNQIMQEVRMYKGFDPDPETKTTTDIFHKIAKAIHTYIIGEDDNGNN